MVVFNNWVSKLINTISCREADNCNLSSISHTSATDLAGIMKCLEHFCLIVDWGLDSPLLMINFVSNLLVYLLTSYNLLNKCNKCIVA